MNNLEIVKDKNKKIIPKKCKIGTLQELPTDHRVTLFPRLGDSSPVSYPDGNYRKDQE